jgi:hypothetical protein
MQQQAEHTPLPETGAAGSAQAAFFVAVEMVFHVPDPLLLDIIDDIEYSGAPLPGI